MNSYASVPRVYILIQVLALCFVLAVVSSGYLKKLWNRLVGVVRRSESRDGKKPCASNPLERNLKFQIDEKDEAKLFVLRTLLLVELERAGVLRKASYEGRYVEVKLRFKSRSQMVGILNLFSAEALIASLPKKS